MQRSDFEIMALRARAKPWRPPLQAGADSVYFGIGALNMRARTRRAASRSTT